MSNSSIVELAILSLVGGGASYYYFKYIRPAPFHISSLDYHKHLLGKHVEKSVDWLKETGVLESGVTTKLMDTVGSFFRETHTTQLAESVDSGSVIGWLTTTACYKWLKRREVILFLCGTVFSYCVIKSCQQSRRSETILFLNPLKDLLTACDKKVKALFERRNERGLLLIVASIALVVVVKAFERGDFIIGQDGNIHIRK